MPCAPGGRGVGCSGGMVAERTGSRPAPGEGSEGSIVSELAPRRTSATLLAQLLTWRTRATEFVRRVGADVTGERQTRHRAVEASAFVAVALGSSAALATWRNFFDLKV